MMWLNHERWGKGMKWSLVCELAEGDQSHMRGSDTGKAQHSFTWLILEPQRQPALQILLESRWWNCCSQPRCSYKEALQETPEASVMAKENFPIIPQSNLNKLHHPAAGTISVLRSFFREFQMFLDPQSSWFNNRSKSFTSQEVWGIAQITVLQKITVLQFISEILRKLPDI